MTKIFKNSIISTLIISSTFLTGCATATLLKKDNGVRTQNVQTTLIDDNVLAFGKPAQAVSNLPNDSIVIVGEKNSYVLTQGGGRFAKLISSLDAKNIQITKDLTFYSANNDGNFSGSLPLTYVKLSEDVSKADREFFIENGAEECTNSSDHRLKAQRFCFNLKLAGVVYPAASNSASFKTLSKPYQISIYTRKQVKDYSNASSKTADKLILFPFAVAFDVVTLPFQAVHKIFD
ncbi:hypothetical protein [Acinetobacter sp. ANC 4648]|uniref:hypothetical protein n=1 Tax=Acinetobacter sp. ANC 4648 TaxID=1977875 RepID=UPI000A3559E1|nr:hypothetical protein [Acinetobacter sp. ANC 4648]OTG83603.1 hypothetical protein B9T27_03555 [Acinetobacter sp. ANC 4648]